MTKQEELKQLQARKVALLTIMASSDAHAAKCAKLGKKFSTQYPDDYAAYVAANEEYQTVEQRVSNLEFEISIEENPESETVTDGTATTADTSIPAEPEPAADDEQPQADNNGEEE